jgi:hypothetical protein
MFNERRRPDEVAVALNLGGEKVSKYYREWWNLRGMYDLNQIYEDIGYDIFTFIELHKRIKTEGLTPQQVTRILKTTTTLEYNIEILNTNKLG